MALIVLTSASGAPGVSVTALGMALSWPRRALLIDADPVGGSTHLAGWFNANPPHHRGLINLAMAADRTELTDALVQALIPLVPDRADLVAGVRSPAQAAAASRIWPDLAEVLLGLESTGTDALVDAGRLGMTHYPTPLLDLADSVLLVTAATLPAVSAARGRVRELHDRLRQIGNEDRLGIVLVGPGRTFSAREVQGVLGAPVLAALPWDPRTAQAFHLGEASSRLNRGPLARALATTASSVLASAATHRVQAVADVETAGVS